MIAAETSTNVYNNRGYVYFDRVDRGSSPRSEALVMPTNSRLVWVLTKPLKIRGILRWALL
jgi:hypothetical protein